MELPENRLWTVEEAAYFLNVPVKTLYQWKWLGEGPPVRKIGRHLRYSPAAVRAWAEPEARAA
ncbi:MULTISPECIES: helix-turn-helix transcriptional regulator [Nocardia]|uniref:helix-turn-helix transcriptional regulator n=1 Tax=Nocardia TaxID=1817 RepID=UPI000BF1C25F|nr:MULTISPECIES: helix-turn-helix domain-containing protein [Nocardia]MBF6072871.1 helix-turn-helix domain-containing protein [Nocardia farcinica]MBF6310905.1 helix-turn-helix domain-containing protein [Nocardia farcinica]MBF6409841.1 helix-turn-helix domain-containing protein [Nocardia farcinica]PEH77273.1 excisionase [Nocardia sp. FDAARGOS_372]UEX21792.1 helix-turn-helix domain-containing protein [Nocardia farcinica]